MRRDAARLEDIRAACVDIAALIPGKTLEQFGGDLAFRYAVLHCLMIIGEASNQLSPDLTARHPDIPWRDIIGLRHRVVHDYAGLDLQIIWDVVERLVPPLHERVVRLLGNALTC